MNQYTLEEIKAAFIPDDQELWLDPDLNSVSWDDRDFLAWKHPKAGNYFVCVEDNGKLMGMIFQMNTGAGNLGASCDLCFATNDELGVKSAFIEVVDKPRRKLGVHVCSDLACSSRVRGVKPGVFMYETISVGRKVERLQEKIRRFACRIYKRQESA